MAEKNLAYRASGNSEFFADDDPLAELARIVGFDPRPAPSPAPAVNRQEPAFDLEDELLREFERYDAPRLLPGDDRALIAEIEAAYDEPAYSPPVNENNPPLEPHHRAEPSFEELQPEAEAADIEAQAYEYDEFEPQLAAETPVGFDRAPEFEHAPGSEALDVHALSGADVSPAGNDATAHYEAQSLADELELALDASPAEPAARAPTPQWAAASIRLPLANFNAPRREQAVQVPEPEVSPVEHMQPAAVHEPLPAIEPEFEQPSSLGFPAEQDRHEVAFAKLDAHDDLAPADEPATDVEAPLFDLAEAAAHGAVEADSALTEPAYGEPPAGTAFEVDDLLADVLRYPVPARDASPVLNVEPVPPAVSEWQPEAKAEPVMAAPAPAERVRPAAEESEQDLANADDPFSDHDFDIDIAGIELELANFDFTEAKGGEPASAQPAPRFSDAQVPVSREGVAAPASLPAAPVAAAAAASVAASVVAQAVRPELSARPATAPIAPSHVAPSAPQRAQPAFDVDQALPFDPSEIGDTEDRIETFEGMHVPALPPVEKDEPVAMPPEYDFDIDAEMANLFGVPVKAASPEQPRGVAASGPAAWAKTVPAAETAAKNSNDDLDEFERALEADFRRSIDEAAHPAENVARMTLEPASVPADRRSARSIRGFAVAAAAVVVLGAGAYGVYGWVSRSSSLGLSSGEPRVITADKEPVKVAPENPGGKVVPNQDKAVYDRVAGDAAQAPKQKELVSSDEQPVDVVQKTLIPETASEEDDGGGPINATPVGETEDPRLLPDQNKVASANDQGSAVPSVSARKVRTMIVKPDGTLVPRDDVAATPVDNAVKPAAAQVAPATAANAPTAKTPAASQIASAANVPAAQADDDAASAESTPIRVVKTTKVDEAPASPAAPASVAAPVPSARPANPSASAAAAATDHAAARPATATQTASAAPAAQAAPAAPAAVATSAAGAGGYGVQIASLPSEAEAKKSQANLSSKFASIIGGHPLEIRKADIAGKGTYYRVRVVAGSKDDAAAMCERYRQAGGTCLISK